MAKINTFDIEQKISNLCGIGISTRDIKRIIKIIYGSDLSQKFYKQKNLLDVLLIINEFKTKKIIKLIQWCLLIGLDLKLEKKEYQNNNQFIL